MLWRTITGGSGMTTRPRTRLTRVAAVCLAACGLLASCGDDDDDAASVSSVAAAEATDTTDTTEAAEASATSAAVNGTTPGTEATTDSAPESTASTSEVCAARDELAESVSALGAVSISDVRSSGVSAIGDAIGAVREDLGELGSAAGTELRSQVGDVQTAIDELQTAVEAVGDGGGVRPAISALGNVVSTAGTLLTSLGTRCPTATSTPSAASTPDEVATTAG
jgi:hypothetical protein